jgi:hypothetical protein
LANLAPSLNVDYKCYSNKYTNDLSAVSTSILGTQYTPWARPGNFTWPVRCKLETERVGKPDSTAYIQNLINTNGCRTSRRCLLY